MEHVLLPHETRCSALGRPTNLDRLQRGLLVVVSPFPPRQRPATGRKTRPPRPAGSVLEPHQERSLRRLLPPGVCLVVLRRQRTRLRLPLPLVVSASVHLRRLRLQRKLAAVMHPNHLRLASGGPRQQLQPVTRRTPRLQGVYLGRRHQLVRMRIFMFVVYHSAFFTDKRAWFLFCFTL